MSGRNDTNTENPAELGRRVVIVVFEGANALDVAGPSTVFSTANHFLPNSYELVHAGVGGEELRSESGLRFSNLVALAEVGCPIDTLVIVGGEETAIRRLANDAKFVSMLQELSGPPRRIASICTGAFVLAAAGLLDGKRAVTHWASCDLLASLFPSVDVDPNAIFVQDGKVFTSAGVSAGIDLALALVEADHGSQLANKIAKSLVVYLRRPGGQAQFSSVLSAQGKEEGPFSDLVPWISENLKSDLSVEVLAAQARMSERTFHRRFAQWAGETPASFVRKLRIETARRWLETTAWPIKRVAHEAGFGSVDSLERAFAKKYGTSPGAVRARFGTK
ncbi:MAG: helix-turn-helix domain-containing protein [Parvularcula sp.]|jgi:transcriptional regulator GlxA family with amidase domain|nr:helix-turn-helix domain-containing protein [Parvularcula sp.]